MAKAASKKKRAGKKSPAKKKPVAKAKSASAKKKAAKKVPTKKARAKPAPKTTAAKKKAPAPAKKKVEVKTKPAKKKAATAKPEPVPKAVAPPKPVKKKLSADELKAIRLAKTARRRKLKQFHVVLVDRHQNLVRAYVSTKGNARSSGSDGTEDYIDYAVSSYDRDFSLSLTEMERKQIRLVEEALHRIDAGTYGSCQQCEQEIPEKRLEVEPWARHCIRCQELDDRGLLAERFDDGDQDDDDDVAESDGAGAEADSGDDVEPVTAGDDSDDDDETEDELSV
jgi:DnaK suppressor protein